jgi:hypothetical protein
VNSDSELSFLDRWPRRTLMVGGPLDGQDRALPLPEGAPDPAYRCYRRGTDLWTHYVRAEDGSYVCDGPCTPTNHGDDPLPHDHECCCGRADCDGRGPWPGEEGR